MKRQERKEQGTCPLAQKCGLRKNLYVPVINLLIFRKNNNKIWCFGRRARAHLELYCTAKGKGRCYRDITLWQDVIVCGLKGGATLWDVYRLDLMATSLRFLPGHWGNPALQITINVEHKAVSCARVRRNQRRGFCLVQGPDTDLQLSELWF